MKNLEPFNEDCFEIHKKSVNKKHKSELKTRLEILNPNVETAYKFYSKHFKSNQLNLLTPNMPLAKSKDDLLTLYKYQSSVIIGVRDKIKKLQIKTITSTCQNCTLDLAGTLDHILPQSDYPEFVVNPLNLFPCCSSCNSYKSDAIAKDSNQNFLNLYLDILPKQQYLFVDIFLDSYKEIDFKFYLKNIDNHIPSALFLIIENHYEKLHLFEKFKLKSIEYLSELESKISSFKKRLTVEIIISDLTDAIRDDKEAYGDNHWKCILELSLINSDVFMAKFN